MLCSQTETNTFVKNKLGTRGHIIFSEVKYTGEEETEESTIEAKAYILIFSREKLYS